MDERKKKAHVYNIDRGEEKEKEHNDQSFVQATNVSFLIIITAMNQNKTIYIAIQEGNISND